MIETPLSQYAADAHDAARDTAARSKRPYYKLAPAPQSIADLAYDEVLKILRHNGYQRLSTAAQERLADAIANAIISAARSNQER